MDERTSLQRIMQNSLLRWTSVATGFVLYVVVVSLIAIETPQLAEYLAPIGFGVVAIHFIFTVSNEMRRRKQTQREEKAKRQRLDVGDDGELVEIVETEGEEKRRNSATSQ
jgi:membrane protein implicated in regulation of membrane protease activity